MDPLTFAELRAVDVKRCDTAFGEGNKMMDWSPTDWACALAGEVGEACNLIKKARRDGRGYDIGRVANIAKELADCAIYVDLLAARLGIDLGAAVRAKFNEVSARVGSAIKLPVQTTPILPPWDCPKCGTTNGDLRPYTCRTCGYKREATPPEVVPPGEPCPTCSGDTPGGKP